MQQNRINWKLPFGIVLAALTVAVVVLSSGVGYAGAATLDALRNGARFMKITTAGRVESHPHDVTITREAPNYHRG